jgi:uncharacterized protein (TIGR03000 family)
MIYPSPPPRLLLALVVSLSAAPVVHGQPDQPERRAFVTIRVHPDAKLKVEGQATRQTSALRRFYSPPLEPGLKYSYTFVAEWMPDNNYVTHIVKRKVSVEAGKSVEVDMRKVDTSKGDTLFVRFVPTPPKIIDAMMELAKVGKDDVVYDLGCGQGDLVIAAVKQFHAKRGVGIDLDPERIREAKKKAKEAGVEDKIELREGNVFDVKDLSEASVVMLYMSNDLNVKLMPILKKQLKPGARIVSHRFTMGEWKPDKTEKVDIQHDIDAEKLIHLWTIDKK